jgi:putative acetyltransferase
MARKFGVASHLLTHVISIARENGYRTVSLEMRSQEFFKPARNLYEKFGLRYCGSFADYKEDPHSRFMTREFG